MYTIEWELIRERERELTESSRRRSLYIISSVCVCVCVWERERERWCVFRYRSVGSYWETPGENGWGIGRRRRQLMLSRVAPWDEKRRRARGGLMGGSLLPLINCQRPTHTRGEGGTNTHTHNRGRKWVRRMDGWGSTLYLSTLSSIVLYNINIEH